MFWCVLQNLFDLEIVRRLIDLVFTVEKLQIIFAITLVFNNVQILKNCRTILY